MATVPEIPSLRKPRALPVHHEEDDPMITLDEQIAEAQRELALRRKCYPQWIKRGKFDAGDAYHQLQAMAAIVRTLQRLEVEQRQLSLFGSRE
jgi:hypothetical protein